MELRQLRMFCAVSELGSFTGAAERVHCVPSNVTMRLKELERELEQTLLVRQKSGVTLTAAGRTFLGYAQQIMQLADESRKALQDTSTPRGALKIGAMETTAAIRLPKVLAKYRERHPVVQLSLVTGTTAELVKSVRSHSLDGAFVGGFHQAPELHQEPIFEEELVLVSSSRHRKLDRLVREMSRHSILVFRSGCFYRSSFERWLHQTGLVAANLLELGTLDGILSCVSMDMGLTLLPRAVIESHSLRKALYCHALPPDVARVPTVFIRRNDAFETSALRAMVDIAQRQFEGLNGQGRVWKGATTSGVLTNARVPAMPPAARPRVS